MSDDKDKAIGQIKKYHKWKKKTITEKADTETKRLKQDMKQILKDLKITKTRAVDDFIRNIGNLRANKKADVSDLNYYIRTSKTRTGQDLTTALQNESRRFSLEAEKINQSLADSGLTFSERRPEQIAKESSAIEAKRIKTEANRSFQDIARYEAAKNRDIQLKYGQAEEEAKVGKKRTLEDILNEKQAQRVKNQRGLQDIAFGKAVNIKEASYERDTDIATTEQLFEQGEAAEDRWEELYG